MSAEIGPRQVVMHRSQSSRNHLIGGIGLLILVAVGYTWATWKYFTTAVPGGNDFMAHYSAWEAFIDKGYDPYSDETALYTQRIIYGRPARPGEDQNRLTYPFYSLIIHAPFILLDYPLARAIYMTLLQAALLVGVWLNLDLIGWRPDKWLLAMLLFWALIFYPQARGIILGQFAIFGYFSLVMSLFLIKKKRDFFAGMVLVISTIKPTLVYLVIPFLLLNAVFRKRYQFIVGFILTLLLLVTGSFLLLPTWLNEWLSRMSNYAAYTVGQSPVWLITNSITRLGLAGEITSILLMLTGMFIAWVNVYKQDGDRHFYWVLCVTLVVSNLIVPRSATTNYVMLLFPTLWIMSGLDHSGFWGKTILIFTLVTSLIGYWWLHFATVVGNQEQPVMFLPYPILVGLFMLFGRRWLYRDLTQLPGIM